jgi:hypothetical protein
VRSPCARRRDKQRTCLARIHPRATRGDREGTRPTNVGRPQGD